MLPGHDGQTRKSLAPVGPLFQTPEQRLAPPRWHRPRLSCFKNFLVHSERRKAIVAYALTFMMRIFTSAAADGYAPRVSNHSEPLVVNGMTSRAAMGVMGIP